MIRQGRVKLRWSRRPYRFRPRKSDYAPDDRCHEESRHETPLADTAPIPADGGRSTTVGSGLPISSGVDGARKAKKIDGLFFNLLCRKFNYFQFCRGIHMGKDAIYLGYDDIL